VDGGAGVDGGADPAHHDADDGADVVAALVLDLLEWIGPAARPYDEVMEAWRTSCPRLPVWETANELGLVERRSEAGGGRFISVSAAGAAHLRAHRTFAPA
jgi:hypothetical protein